MNNSSNKKEFVALAAPSGGGKTTLCRMLLEKYPNTCLSISFTSRAPRGQEKDGEEYNFVTQEDFKKLIESNDLIEWAQVHGNYYGTSREFLEKQSAGGKIVLLIVDVQGIKSLKKAFGDRCLSIFLLPPSLEILEARLRDRQTEAEAKLQERLNNAKTEMLEAPSFDYQIINDNLNECFKELCQIVESETHVKE